jgi:hypothetical protein
MKLPARESEFQRQVIELAQLYRWRVAHFRPARTAKGWRTAVSADGAGFPDLVLVRDGVLIFAELKTDKGQVSDAQQAWLDSLSGTPGIHVSVWRPRDWARIQTVLTTAVV